MSMTALLTTVVALLARGATADGPIDVKLCGPFAITTTSGTLYSPPNGTQVPGLCGTKLEVGSYFISDGGSMMTKDGFLCEFRPHLLCLPNVTRSEGDGSFVIGEGGSIYYDNDRNFYGCSPDRNGTLAENLRIFPGCLGPSDGSGDGTTPCTGLGMQASHRFDPEDKNQDANPAWRAEPAPLPTTSMPSCMDG